MEIFLVIAFVVLCLFVALALYVMATRKELPPDSEVMPGEYLDDVSDATRKAWEAIK